nr:hypothetical protein [Tanacetum cinerariifolium]
MLCIDELHKFSDDTLNDVRTALDDILKRIRMKYLPHTFYRNVDKERAGAMIQAIDKHLKNRRIMRSLEKFVGGRPSILRDLQETLKRKWRYLIPADSHIHNHMLIPDYQDTIFLDFYNFDEFECYQVIKIGRYEHSEDIQEAGSDTRPPMLDRTDFESWQQRAQLYYLSQLENDRLRADIRAINILIQADQCDAFDSVVDEAPTAQIMFMANLFSAAPVYDEAGLSYDSDTLSEVQNHDNCHDDINEYHEEHEIQHDVQPNNVVNSDTEYTSTSNIISYER